MARLTHFWFEIDDLVAHFGKWTNVTGIQRVSMELVKHALSESPARCAPVGIDRIAGSFESADGPILAHLGERNHADCSEPGSFSRSARPGDYVISTGAAWPHWHFARALKKAKKSGLRASLLVHDVLPLTHPQFFKPSAVRRFRRGIDRLIDLVDVYLVSSNHVRDHLLNYFANRSLQTPRIQMLRFGTGFTTVDESEKQSATDMQDPYVLLVSTLEPRKNHLLAIEVWRRLIGKYGAGAIPRLLFIGRTGWLTGELMNELGRTNWLEGKIAWQSDCNDQALASAYDNCLFTIFPSLAEGWGLPVTESLDRGKPCVCSNYGPLPEAGGSCADYFDPSDPNDALHKIERALFEPGYLARRAAEIRSGFVQRSWSACARDLVQGLEGS